MHCQESRSGSTGFSQQRALYKPRRILSDTLNLRFWLHRAVF